VENLAKRIHFFLFILIACLRPSPAQISVISPSSKVNVRACADFADEVLLDRWDMNERTDLGWRIYNTYELPLSYLSNISFSGGIFSAQSGYTPGMSPPLSSDVNITILDSAYPNAAVIGKTGKKFPVNANKYTILVMRMYIEPDIEGQPYGQGYLFWSKDTMYNGVTTSYPFNSRNDWFVYFIDIPSLGIISGSDPWDGWIDSLRMDPISIHDKEIRIDWIRLVEKDISTRQTISWTGASGNIDIYLDNDNDPLNGNLGLLAQNISGNSYSFLAGGLASGDYHISVTPTGTLSYSYSPGYYHVNDIPIVQITKPSEEGSDVDFANMTFSDPWAMDNSEDVEYTINVKNTSFQSISYEDLVGNVFPNQSAFYGESEPSGGLWGDPIVYFLYPWFGKRGVTYSIDTSKYHNLVFKMGISGTYSYNDGSISRVVWKKDDESLENVSRDIVIKHFSDRWLMNKIVCDLNTLPLEEGEGSPSHSGWTGLVNAFRIDPHEFADSHAFFYDDVKITADWTANNSFTIEWDLEDLDNNLFVSLYYDTDNLNFDGTLIVPNLASYAGSDNYVWDTSGVPEGKYWIYAVVFDEFNQSKSYASGPIIIDHNLIPEISLSKSVLYFGAEIGDAATSKEKVFILNTGEGALDWQVSKNAAWIDVSPLSGNGDGTIEVGIDHSGLSVGNYQGVITITDAKASNSPQIINVNLTVYGAGGDSPPFGYFDTPTSGSNVSGSVAVTGWALDDIEVIQVEIKRAPDMDDDPSVIGPDGLVYIGNAVSVKGARPDVEAIYGTYPRADRTGWGYMMLTHFLPRGGNGTFGIYAIALDTSGHRVNLGEKIINCDNAGSLTPFGTIDTPAQGGNASGNAYLNFGWALTPQPKTIPKDGSTIWVWVDGAALGHPVYNNYRVDITTLFPGYNNSDGAVGYYYLDTTQYTNGVHFIAWSAEDDQGEVAGLGSRYFDIQNLEGASGESFSVGTLQLLEDTSGRLRIGVESIKRGFRRSQDEDEVEAEGKLIKGQTITGSEKLMERSGVTKLSREVEIEQLERIEIHFEGQGEKFIGWGADKGKPLPIGSTLDSQNGVFYWIPGPGFLGKHVLHFAVTDGVYQSKPTTLVVNIVPKTYQIK